MWLAKPHLVPTNSHDPHTLLQHLNIPAFTAILSSLQADLFGDVAEAKEAAEFAGAYKEAKKCRAYETYQLLASIISFGDRIAELLTTVQVRGWRGSWAHTHADTWARLHSLF